jgi:hypothetical protein
MQEHLGQYWTSTVMARRTRTSISFISAGSLIVLERKMPSGGGFWPQPGHKSILDPPYMFLEKIDCQKR